MKRIDSDALGLITRALGMTGKGAQITELLDGQVEQNLDIIPIVRRGRTLAGSQGIFTGILRNVHAGAGDILTTYTPYTVNDANREPFPSPIPEQFDLWLISAAVSQVSGTGTLTASLSLDYFGRNQGFGIDDSGVAITASDAQHLGFWDSLVTQGGETFGITEAGEPMIYPRMRLVRNESILFSTTASALATFDCQLLVGLFPTTLGQDVLI